MPYDPNLTRIAEQDLKDAYWDATERQQAQLRELYESEYEEDSYGPYRYAERDY